MTSQNRMVPKRSDHYFNIVQCPDESVKDVFKQTILHQEIVFKKQVHELHRVYKMQKVMMKNLRLKEVAKPQPMDYSRHDYRGKWSHRPLDFDSSAGYYMNYSNKHLLHKGHEWGTQEMPIQVECYFQEEAETSAEELELSLNIGGHASYANDRKSWELKVTPSSSPYIIDLEETTEVAFNRGTGPTSKISNAICSTHSGDQKSLPFWCSCANSSNEGFSSNVKRSLSFVDESADCREKSSLNQDYEEQRCEGLSCVVKSVGESSTPCKAALFDLNGPPRDEASFLLKDHTVVHSLGGASGDASEGLVVSPNSSSSRKLNDSLFSQVSALTPTAVSTAFNGNDDSTNGGLCSIGLDSSSKVPYENSNQECLTSNSQRKEGELGFEVACRKGKCIEDSQSAYVSRKEDFVKEVDMVKCPIASKVGDHAADPSSSLKTIQSEACLENSVPLVSSLQSSESPQLDYGSSDEYLSKSSPKINKGLALDDALIRKGAVSLLYFMSETSATWESHSNGEVDTRKGKADEPECSLDSFELAVLKLQETTIDDYNDVTSNTYEVKDIDEKVCPIKLTRGRRMKDFQKDILPSLASLSRREICEDVRLMEGVIRSREYKRLRSKTSSEHSWFTPVKSKRSRLNYIGRRYYN